MNSNDCKLKIKIYYKNKQFEEESKYIIPLQKIKEKAIKEFDIIKEDEDFINFEYHSNKENKNYSIEEDNDIIKYSEEDSSGDLLCKFELIINNPKSKMKENELSNENKGEIIESKTSNKNINQINENAKEDIKEDEKENYKNEINKLRLEIEKIKESFNSELENLKKENSEKEKKVKESEQLINNLEKNIKIKENEITDKNLKLNNLSSKLEESKKECENINNQKLQIESEYKNFKNFNVDWKDLLKKADENYKNLLKKISTLEGAIEKIKSNKNILDEYRNERNEEKKELKENENNKNKELIKSVIEQMKLEQKNEVIEKNKILEEENKNLKNIIKEMENQNKLEIEKQQYKHFEGIVLILNEMFKEIDKGNKNINSILGINANKKENDNKKKSKKSLNWFKKDSNKSENINLSKETKKEYKNVSKEIIISNNGNSQITQEGNKDILSDFVIFDENKEMNIPNKNILDNKDKYNNLIEQLISFYETSISKENIFGILNKIREIILLIH